MTSTTIRIWLYTSLPVLFACAPLHAAGFKITFGVKSLTNGRVWSGGIRNPSQLRSLRGWHLSDHDSISPPDRWNITLESVGGEVAAKAVILDLRTPDAQPVTIFTRYGDFTFVPAEIPYDKPQPVKLFNGDVTVERVPIPQIITGPETEDDDPALLRTQSGEQWLAWVAYRTRARNGYQYTGGDQVMVSRGSHAPTALTPPGDHFRVGLAEDARGRIWCVYAEQKQLETGNFDLYARYYDGARWSPTQQLSTSPLPDTFHRLTSDRNGNLYLTWMGFRPGAQSTAPQSDIFLRVFNGDRWGDEINISRSPDNDWEPSISVDSSGRAWIAWDSYRATADSPATYHVLLRTYSPAEGLGPLRTVSATPYAEMRADVAVDARDRVWLTWEEGGLNWGKDIGYSNPRHKIWLRPGGSQIYGPPNSATALYRRPRIAVLENGQWRQPKARIEAAYSPSLQSNLYLSPHLGLDSTGRIWLFLRHQLTAQGRNGGQMFDYYATTLTGENADQRWLAPILLPASTGRQDTVLASAPADSGIAVAVVGDGRHFPVPLPVNHDIATLQLPITPPYNLQLEPFQPSPVEQHSITHPEEARQVADIRAHRIDLGGVSFKIVRGDLHRHTEISMDGAIDGSLWDLYRYALDAAALDFIAVTDHNYGAWLDTDEPESKNTDNEYQWWRTQKSADLFYLPGRFVPLYGYERSVNFPRGHRNVFHVRRGVFSYRVPKLFISERPELIDKDAQGLWSYLRSTGGIGLPHSTGTNMGTDWRLRNDELEPVAELYSGDWGGFEALGQPRAATAEATGGGFSGRVPFVNGLIWNALGVGYKMGFTASSDHWSTHIAYANLLVPDRVTSRADILDSLRQRHTYASTDNIILDFSADNVLQGGELQAAQSPTFHVRVQGTEAILRVEIIKNNRVVFSQSASGTTVEFTYRDNDHFADTSVAPTNQIRNWTAPETGIRPRPETKAAYYYVRAIQRFSREAPDREGETAWSSPIYVRPSP